MSLDWRPPLEASGRRPWRLQRTRMNRTRTTPNWRATAGTNSKVRPPPPPLRRMKGAERFAMLRRHASLSSTCGPVPRALSRLPAFPLMQRNRLDSRACRPPYTCARVCCPRVHCPGSSAFVAMRPDRQQTPDPCLACRPPINARALAAHPTARREQKSQSHDRPLVAG